MVISALWNANIPFWIYTLVTKSTSYDDNNYAMKTSLSLWTIANIFYWFLSLV